MPFLHYLQYQIRYYIFRKRWLLPYPRIALPRLPQLQCIAMAVKPIVITVSGCIGWRDPPMPGICSSWPSATNSTSTSPSHLLYIYLVCDLLPEPPHGTTHAACGLIHDALGG